MKREGEKQQRRIIHKAKGKKLQTQNIVKVVMTKYITVNVAHKRNSHHYREHCTEEGHACDQEHGVPLIKADVADNAWYA